MPRRVSDQALLDRWAGYVAAVRRWRAGLYRRGRGNRVCATCGSALRRNQLFCRLRCRRAGQSMRALMFVRGYPPIGLPGWEAAYERWLGRTAVRRRSGWVPENTGWGRVYHGTLRVPDERILE